MLQKRGVDILPFDKKFNIHTSWTRIYQGGPEKLDSPAHKHRTLFLCYPDDSWALSTACLQRYSGEYVVHVGELITTGTKRGYPQAPFGRTTASDGQVMLMERYHCVLMAEIPRYPFSQDCITVWKQTNWVEGRRQDDNDKDDVGEEANGDRDEENEDENLWASTPLKEMIRMNCAAPSLQHFL